MLSLAVDAWALSDGSQYRGIGTYLRHVLAGLAERPDVDPVAIADCDVALPPGVRRRPVAHRLRWPLQEAEHDLRLRRAIPAAGCRVFWSPAQSPPQRCQVPWVQTLHDLTPLVFVHPETARDRRHWLRAGPRLRSAAAVVCPSRSSADQGVRYLGLDPSRVHVVANGVDERFRPGRAAPADPPYLLLVGAWGPHKGFTEALAVIAALARAGYPHRLRLVGRQDAWMARQLHRAVEAAERPDRVDVVGYVDNLVDAYRAATALLMPSRAEGFGLPAAEAMACGTPVVAFANTALPEVLGDAGVLVPDGDVPAMVDAVRAVIDDGALRARLRTAGPRRAGAFSWARTVDQLADVFQRAAG